MPDAGPACAGDRRVDRRHFRLFLTGDLPETIAFRVPLRGNGCAVRRGRLLRMAAIADRGNTDTWLPPQALYWCDLRQLPCSGTADGSRLRRHCISFPESGWK